MISRNQGLGSHLQHAVQECRVVLATNPVEFQEIQKAFNSTQVLDLISMNLKRQRKYDLLLSFTSFQPGAWDKISKVRESFQNVKNLHSETAMLGLLLNSDCRQ
jgi:hypothetical protein